MKHQLKIELKSDLCSGNGESYGALIDNDICYDSYGLPYIPAKRLKGCLRDSAEELVAFGLYCKDQVDGLFGVKGQNKPCPLYIGNAYLANHEADIYAIENEEKHKEHLSPANVLNNYTYLRAQTAVEQDTGIAKKKSLRYTRVVKKNTVFCAEINIKNELLEDSAKNLRSIGLNRNRGFGEVQVSIEEVCDNGNNEKFPVETVKCAKEKYKLTYELTLKTPLLLAGNNEETETYIPGSSVLGYFASYVWNGKENDYKGFFNGDIIFGNAYISNEDYIYYPAPAYVKVGKYGGDTAYGSLVDTEVFDDNSTKTVKTESLGGRYCHFEGENIHIKSVETDINYHLFREKNAAENEGNFFQYTSIRAGQTFTGHIIAQGQHIRQFIDYINENGQITLGKSKTAQYGICKIAAKACNPLNDTNGENNTQSNKFVVVLRSPLILHNENGMAIPDVKKFEDILKRKLNTSQEINIAKQYTKIKTVGGYNVTWNLPKQQIPVFDAGSAFVVEIENGDKVDLSAIHQNRFGECTSEGFGEMFAFDYEEAKSRYKIVKDGNTRQDVKPPLVKSCIVDDIAKRVANEQLQKAAMETADGKSKEKIGINSTTIGRLILMLKESDKKETFFQTVEAIKDNDKKEKIKSVIKDLKLPESDADFKIYIQTYLNQLKLLKRGEE